MQNNDILVGLAGHIDHGKTSFIKALNGFDGDESKEEKARGITLDISFSNLKFPSRNIAFIDVPGHEKLIKNMIAGSFSVDVICLIIASDDGLMPQSIEHMQIANFLGIKKCFCVISKCDKSSPHRIQEVKKQIQDFFSSLEISLEKIFTFSTLNQERDKIDILHYLQTLQKPQKEDVGFFRYYIDRAFSISGAGCVVSGSSLSGEIKKGERVFIYDLAKEVNVRGIKIHSDFASSALPSHRVALNLSGVRANELKRGMLISKKGYLRGFDKLDVYLFGFNSLPKYASLHIGAKRVNVKIIPLHFLSSTSCFANLVCEEKIYSIFEEAFILRSNNQTLCGGKILAPITDPIKKTQKVELLTYLLQKDFSKAFLFLASIHLKGFGLISSSQRFALSHFEACKIAKELKEVFFDEKNLVLYSIKSTQKLTQNILSTLEKNPNALLSASSLKLKTPWASEPYLQHILTSLHSYGKLALHNGLYTSKTSKIKNQADFLVDKIYNILLSQSYSPEAPYNIYESLNIDRKSGDDALKKLCASQKVVRLEHNLFITTKALNEILALMRSVIEEKSFIDVGSLKEVLPLSRKYLIAYLEYLDSFEDITKDGTKRIYKHQRRQK
ncbi:selenocysteine-specific translation elongation factor [Helicobacter cholecystus]|uniref:Selenocysteine-specific translation elongation factor n=1 Tax=Helicobacter cholecystus TaxID=45498 RepID=A0A3D8IWF6_9HELI|nr:selenocysteine-specific translation elongation factor [Helicobacter cholecystus]RDU69572.1 selenocysteine-specific translation elongation factor [Helicobacter cholecystus]VEJ24129.1 selenocysteine-specific elongation factor SelB [Helicobacter cholecystus]